MPARRAKLKRDTAPRTDNTPMEAHVNLGTPTDALRVPGTGVGGRGLQGAVAGTPQRVGEIMN